MEKSCENENDGKTMEDLPIDKQRGRKWMSMAALGPKERVVAAESASERVVAAESASEQG